MKSQKREPGKRRKPRLSFGGLTVEEAYRQMFAPAAYKPPPPLAEEERKRLAARIAADAGVREARARIERQLFQPPSEKEVLDIKVRMLLGSLCSKPERPPPPMPKMSQSGKLDGSNSYVT